MQQFTVPDLNYEYGALAPVSSEQIMKLHHGTHHAGYVAKLNAAVEQLEGSATHNLETLLCGVSQLPDSVRTAIRNNGGGHYNHSFFWECMTPGGSAMSAQLQADIEARYGSVEGFKEAFTDAALGLFGSGWVWLSEDLDITTAPNQDNPIMNGERPPILGLDVWEHAYYLDYYAARKDYADAWWGVVNWEFVSSKYAA